MARSKHSLTPTPGSTPGTPKPMNEPTPSDTPETDAPCGGESVTPQQIRQIVERLFHTPMSLSLKQWGPIGSSLLGAATKIETLERQRNEARAQRDVLADALREILKADEECEAEFAKMGIPAEPEHWTTTKAKAALATLDPKP